MMLWYPSGLYLLAYFYSRRDCYTRLSRVVPQSRWRTVSGQPHHDGQPSHIPTMALASDAFGLSCNKAAALTPWVDDPISLCYSVGYQL